MGALERVGAKLFVERLRLEWRPGTPVAELSGRLTFRPVRNPDELIELMTLVLDGTLDAHSRDDLTRMAPVRPRRSSTTTNSTATPALTTGADRDATGRRTGRVRDPRTQRYNPIIAYLGSSAGTSRPTATFTTCLPRERACWRPERTAAPGLHRTS